MWSQCEGQTCKTLRLLATKIRSNKIFNDADFYTKRMVLLSNCIVSML